MNTDEIKSIADKLKKTQIVALEHDCYKIKGELLDSLEKISNNPKLIGQTVNSHVMNLKENKKYFMNLKSACGIDTNKYEKQIENITNLKTKLIFEEENKPYSWENKVKWTISLDVK